MKIELEGKVYDLDIDQAKKLNLLKEGDTTCKSWKEYCEKYQNQRGYYFLTEHNHIEEIVCPTTTAEQLTKEEAVAIGTFSKLLKLRRDWIGDWNPNWDNGDEKKYCIIWENTQVCISFGYTIAHPFSFPTKEMAKEFLECFKDLFEQCKNII